MSAIEWQVKLDLAYTRGVVINPREHLTEWVPREGIVLVNSKTIGLSSMEVEALLRYNRPITARTMRCWPGYGHMSRPPARTSQGKRSTAKPGKDRRLRVNSKGLYWWIMMEWLARTAPYTAVQVLRGNFEIHHLKPYLLDKPKGNALANLRIVRAVPEHSQLNSAQRKIRKCWKDNHSL